jgi:predicted RNase H-like HicB family nuclease
MEGMSMRYVALVDGKHGAYGVVVPDLPGCTSMGETTDEAHRNAIEAVRLWIEDAEAEGEAVPRPRSLEALREDPDVAAALAQGAVLTLVPLLRDVGRAVKANLSLDVGLLEAIDAEAKARGLTRSAFITSAAREKITAEREWRVETALMGLTITRAMAASFTKINLRKVRSVGTGSPVIVSTAGSAISTPMTWPARSKTWFADA